MKLDCHEWLVTQLLGPGSLSLGTSAGPLDFLSAVVPCKTIPSPRDHRRWGPRTLGRPWRYDAATLGFTGPGRRSRRRGQGFGLTSGGARWVVSSGARERIPRSALRAVPEPGQRRRIGADSLPGPQLSAGLDPNKREPEGRAPTYSSYGWKSSPVMIRTLRCKVLPR